jgi:tetratricopeptide (TPR) repeat protein
MIQHPSSSHYGERVPIWRSSNYISEWSLRPAWRAALFLVPILAGGLWLAYEAVRVAWVASLLDTFSAAKIQKALQLDPGNADLAHSLGQIYCSIPTDINLSESVKYLRLAAHLSPGRWDFWSDLGTTCDFVGDTACSDDAFNRAHALNPMTPALQWTLGNHYLLTNRDELAFPCFRSLLEKDPDYLYSTLRLCMRAVQDPQTIYAKVIPQDRDASARFAFLVFLSQRGDFESAMRIWREMISGPDRSPDVSKARVFLDLLIGHNQIRDASAVWEDLRRAGAIPPASNPQPENLLYDAHLTRPPLNMGFAWRVIDSPDLEIELADPSGYQAQRCLRISFVVGRNDNYDLVEQVVLVQPNTRYQLSAYVRSDSLSSESGPRLRVIEIGCADCPVRTSDATVGTTPWHPIEVAFLTEAQTHAVTISFWRPQEPGPGDITGTVWLDDLLLRSERIPEPDVISARTR